MPQRHAVWATGLSKDYNGLLAVDQIELRIGYGQCFGFLGPNGAGKTTTVRMICCLSPRTSGQLQVLGMDPAKQARSIKKRLGVVPQEDNLDLELTVMENLLVYAGYFGVNRRLAQARALELLDFMDLSDKVYSQVETLSGGLKRRLTLARALVNQPDLLVLDEPTTGLDPQARQLVWQRLRQLREQGLTLILTTHYLEEASFLCDRLVIMHEGHILEEGDPQYLVDKHIGGRVLEAGLPKEQRVQLLDWLRPQWRGYLEVGEVLFIFFDPDVPFEDRLRSFPHQPAYQRVRPPTLEDVFFKLTQRGLED